MHQAALPFDNEVAWLDYHAFAAASGEFLPPLNACLLTHWISDLHYLVGCSKKQPFVCVAEVRERLQVPRVVPIDMHRALRREQVKRRKLEVGDGANRPAIAPIRIDVLTSHLRSLSVAVEQHPDLSSPLVCLCLLQQSNRLAQCGTRGCSHRSILLTQQFLGFYGPGHEFTIQTDPVGVELLPYPRGVQRRFHPRQECGLQLLVLEETPSSAGVADTDPLIDYAEAFPGHLLVSAYDDHRTRTHVLLFTDHAGHPMVAVVCKRFCRMLQQSRLLCRLRR